MKEKIVVLRLNEDRVEYTMTKQLPKEMRDEAVKKIGSEFDKSRGLKSKDIIRGLDRELERVILPNLIGTSPEDMDFPKKAMDFWADYTITPTREGLRLNIAMEDFTKKDGTIIQIPVNQDDYMQYQFAMQSSKVAKTPEEIKNRGWYDFILEDLTEARERELAEFDAQDKATVEYARLSTKFEANMSKINWILEMTKEDTFYDDAIDIIDKKIALKNLAEKRPNEFLRVANDPDLELKAFMSAALAAGILTLEGNNYFYLNEDIGSEERGAISWLKKPEKSGAVAAMRAKLEQNVRNRKQKTI